MLLKTNAPKYDIKRFEKAVDFAEVKKHLSNKEGGRKSNDHGK